MKLHFKKRDFRPNLQREQVRGLFVLGVIATLLGVRNEVDLMVKRGSIHAMISAGVSFLIFYWGLYAFLMSVAVSGDIFNKTTITISYTFAKAMFKIGIGGIAFSIIAGTIFGLVSMLQLPLALTLLITAATFGFGTYILSKLLFQRS
jgi:hypothetical protein